MKPLPPMTPAEFAAELGVSRETLTRLERYADLLKIWQQKINLVGAATLDDLWRRHFLDSAQLLPLLPRSGGLLDVGSGAGFPGLVLAILGASDVHLVEADRRKFAFLRAAARISEADVHLHRARIEEMKPWPVAAITARAVAPLPNLLDLVSSFIAPTTCCIFLKGARLEEELDQARERWRMEVEFLPSRSHPDGRIVTAKRIGRHGRNRA